MARTEFQRQDRRTGQMALFMTLSVFLLFSLIGLSADLGYSYSIKILAQTAADSAATAAARYASKNGYTCGTNITCNSTYTCASPPTAPAVTAFESGCLYANANGFANTGSQTVSLIANNTALSNETGIAPALWIRANVSQTVTHLFLFMAGFQSSVVQTQSVAGVSTIPSSNCVYILSSSAANALNVTGSSSISTAGCGIYDNSTNASTAIDVTGSSTVSATGGGIIQMMAGAGETVTGTSTVSPAPTRVGSGVADPFASLPAPTVSTTCYQTNYNSPSYGTTTISPGVYCGGITVGGSATVNLNPGMYILNGGGFNNGGSGTVNGTGVTFFLTGQNGYTAAGMTLSGASQTNLSAPTSGTYQGVLFYQDRSVTYAAGNNQGGSAGLNATGTFYFPTTSLTLSGAVSESKIALIVSTLTINGSSAFQEDSSGTYTGLVAKTPALIQ